MNCLGHRRTGFVVHRIALFLIITSFASVACLLGARAIQLSGASMEPGYPDGTRLWIEKVDPQQLARGDLVYFELWESGRYFVKRLIGLPGETVRLKSDEIYIDNMLLEEPYPVIPYETMDQTIALGSDQYYVLGDNRPNSADSQNWGPIEGSAIIGRVVPTD